jgi:glycosyltransferase involved in cell wall biosynthesis
MWPAKLTQRQAKYSGSRTQAPALNGSIMFSILIPTWNNLELLKLCVRSIQQNSAYPHQVIVHVNDGSDGSLAWVQEQQLSYTHSAQNIGICLAVNEAAMHAKRDYILYLNDDMYCCPGWDTALVNKMKGLDTDLFMLSGTMIEPVQTSNPCVIVKDYGRSPDKFAEQELLANLPSPMAYVAIAQSIVIMTVKYSRLPPSQ